MYGKKKKKSEKIETEEEYVDLIRSARNPPFEIVRDNDYQIKDFESKIKKGAKIPKGLLISKAVRIDYFPNGTVDVFTEYDKKPSSFFIESSVTFEQLENSEVCSYSGINAAKVKDVRNLMQYLSPEGKLFFEDFFSQVRINEKK